MKTTFLSILLYLFIISCSSPGTKKTISRNVSRNYITAVDNVDGFSAAFTEEGHTIVFTKDSIGNYIVYYVKFDDYAEKYGQDMNKDKIIRLKMDTSLSALKDILSVYGGAFCEVNNDQCYSALYFDELVEGGRKDRIETHMTPETIDAIGEGQEIRKIIVLINVANEIAQSVNNNNVAGWYNIASALGTSLDLSNYDIQKNDTIVNPIVKEHISKIRSVTDRFARYSYILQEKMVNENKP